MAAKVIIGISQLVEFATLLALVIGRAVVIGLVSNDISWLLISLTLLLHTTALGITWLPVFFLRGVDLIFRVFLLYSIVLVLDFTLLLIIGVVMTTTMATATLLLWIVLLISVFITDVALGAILTDARTHVPAVAGASMVPRLRLVGIGHVIAGVIALAPLFLGVLPVNATAFVLLVFALSLVHLTAAFVWFHLFAFQYYAVTPTYARMLRGFALADALVSFSVATSQLVVIVASFVPNVLADLTGFWRFVLFVSGVVFGYAKAGLSVYAFWRIADVINDAAPKKE